ncbi:TOBE domain-containing protein [Calidifontibacter sp. DB0510]|uniref:TOBE domain-containing protein n=1 Tax=Metallococcus carri TaxID=1656884 RepID=A0A967EAF6_9MICO|nr:TOBE domain-containing protein [Metallococcus carri]NHN55834.1 TOBE domain-containing protein [Metallococcus carri]NOP38478.1 TOBE domain-containing protein [Calidifontibacter sp. DB2511S]
MTHDQQEALSLADQVAVLRAGRIAQIGTPHALYTRPIDPDMARFIGEANLLPAQLHGTDAMTPLGVMHTETSKSSGDPSANHTHVLALVRPEQIDILAPDAPDGVPAIVVDQTFHGHDSIVTVRPKHGCGPDLIRARVSGSRIIDPHTPVRVSAAGSTTTWPIAE